MAKSSTKTAVQDPPIEAAKVVEQAVPVPAPVPAPVEPPKVEPVVNVAPPAPVRESPMGVSAYIDQLGTSLSEQERYMLRVIHSKDIKPRTAWDKVVYDLSHRRVK
jgi:hypothetical protein